jgi:hypothetical protein
VTLRFSFQGETHDAALTGEIDVTSRKATAVCSSKIRQSKADRRL